MAKVFDIKENKPYPNSSLPVLFYPEAVKELANSKNNGEEVQLFLEKNGYTNGWIGGIFTYHHFHSNTHEVLVCISGEAQVQLGGPDREIYPFKMGDALLLPAGVAHKLIKATDDFQIVGAYPEGKEPDMQKGDTNNYEEMKINISRLGIPEYDPIEKTQGGVFEYWDKFMIN
ncbi:cupin domain-containing protein [Desemzia sp. RIT804]|uniref:cupin domain-containing protein n=1 Tax=Desemzia sp. RIT 804 TaxID=2810209 RepID=UPI00194DC14A|nr:cupin domain-containing protein [Desemzia sp. RIT 804]MBM6614797.1 cupin domain-containing protein [Desemzia sp. RIT 804]